MIAILSEKLGKKLAHGNEDIEAILKYGIEGFIHFLIWILTLLIISSIFKITKPTFTIFIVYVLLRRCFGGVHAKTYLNCFFLSCTIPIILGYTATRIHIDVKVGLVIYLLAYLTVFFKGVVDNPVKRLKPEQKKQFKKQGIITLTIIATIHIFFIKNLALNNAISLAVFWAFANLYIKNH